jgi:hypothetical protein
VPDRWAVRRSVTSFGGYDGSLSNPLWSTPRTRCILDRVSGGNRHTKLNLTWFGPTGPPIP